MRFMCSFTYSPVPPHSESKKSSITWQKHGIKKCQNQVFVNPVQTHAYSELFILCKRTANIHTGKCNMLEHTYIHTHPYIHWSWPPPPSCSPQPGRGNCHCVHRGTLESWTWLKHMSSILIALRSPRWPEGGEGCLRSCVSCKNNLC